ncbi:MAG: TonB family protein [Proteiniphilum sp.]|jgi:TonB family protein|nr:TonB family protein [Proteiniphilum sp.]
MKKVLVIIMLCGLTGARAQDTPPYAASAKTWKTGSQIWSDHINVPECDKADFNGEGDTPKADCRNNPGYHHLYTWEYVRQNAGKLCPKPWRVPAKEDFIALDKALGGSGETRNAQPSWITDNYITKWGGIYGGFSEGNSVYAGGEEARYWSSSEDAFRLVFGTVGVQLFNNGIKNRGKLVRCVRDEGQDATNDKPLIIAEEMPSFPGSQGAMQLFISLNLQYPIIAQELGIQGRVEVDFIVDTDGRIESPQIVTSVSPELDAEVLRLVSIMPKWNPGKLNGKPVRVRFTMPITFRLQD